MIYVHGELKKRNRFIQSDFYCLKEYFQLCRNIKTKRIKRYISNLVWYYVKKKYKLNMNFL